ncbi:hypothetical protein GYH30_001387 [Glycine max]|nr:hypothetical protein GYH30_001387 [Glycine max]
MLAVSISLEPTILSSTSTAPRALASSLSNQIQEAKKWRVSMPPLGLVIELSDPNTNEDDDHDLDSAVANAVNSASSSIESSSKKRRTSEARVAN